MTTTTKSELKNLDLDKINERPGENPNVLSPPQFTLLVNAIKKLGFLQPVTVRPTAGGQFELIDGHHRVRAAAAAGLKKVPALITTATDAEALAESLSLNRLRGELDLSEASNILQELAESGFEDLTLTGFNGEEIQALLREINSSGANALDQLGEDAGADMDVPVETAKRFALRLTFDTEADRDLIRATALRYGGTVEAGLLAVCTTHPGE